MTTIQRLVNGITGHTRVVIALVLVASLVMAGGLAQLDEQAQAGQFEFGTEEEAAMEYVADNFVAEEDVTHAQIAVRGDDVLTRESFVETISLQERMLADEQIAPTLVDDPFTDLANLVASTAIAAEENRQPGEDLSAELAEQREALEAMSDDEFDALLSTVFSETGQEAAVFLPTDHDLESTSAETRTLFVTQDGAVDVFEIGDAPTAIVESQLQMASLVDEQFEGDGLIYGAGIVTDELDRSLADSVLIIVPIALLFVVGVLALAYRDVIDIVLGAGGVGLVLLWTYGFMGWTGIEVSQIMIVVPVLMIGLSIDYAIHVTMRYRERRATDETLRPVDAMREELGTLGLALLAVTTVAIIAFLSFLTAPMAETREFGIVTGFGITATLVVFGGLLPAVKIRIDTFLESRGRDRRKPAFGTGGGRVGRTLLLGRSAAGRAPWGVLLVVVLLTTGGAAAATDIDTTFDHEEFIAYESPAWADELPGPFATDEYTLHESVEFLNEHFLREDSQTDLLITGDVTDGEVLRAIADAEDAAASKESVLVLPTGEPDVLSPVSLMAYTAETDEDFAAVFDAADTTGDGVPDEDVDAVYAAFFEAAPELAASTIATGDDGYEALRLTVTMEGGTSATDAASVTEELGGEIDHENVDVVATGGLVVTGIVEGEMVDMVLESLFVSIVAILLFGVVAYRFLHGSATFGIVVLAPILLAVIWILGTMSIVGISVNVVTGTITVLTVGLGVAYNIHIGERYLLELDSTGDMWESLERTLTGTGAALFGSALTTAGGFGVLTFAIVPTLQQFGLMAAMTIFYAFIASVVILPTLLVLWTQYVREEH